MENRPEDEEFHPVKQPERKKSMKEFINWYFHVDFKDMTNYLALALAVFLLWWGVRTIIRSLSLGGV